MLVWLYEVIGEIRTERRISVDLTVDYAYWFGQPQLDYLGEVKRLRVYTKRLLLRHGLRWQQGLLDDPQRIIERGVDIVREKSPDYLSWRLLTKDDWRDMDKLGESSVGKSVGEQQLAALSKKLNGRRLLMEEIRRIGLDMGLLTDETDERLRSMVQWLWLQGKVQYAAGMVLEDSFADRLSDWFYFGQRDVAYRRRLRCGRCNSQADKHYTTECAACGRSCVYCEACLQMGRVRECSLMVIGVGHDAVNNMENNAISHTENNTGNDINRAGTHAFAENRGRDVDSELDLERAQKGDKVDIDQEALLGKWGLSPAQKDASGEALAFIRQPAERDGEQFLIWAVTGAGKTEMVYPLVEYMLHEGGRVLLTAPRRDVVLELAPRLAKAFPEREVIALYGGSEHRWEIGEVTVATTHQLLRLDRCFDLVVLDELDAYPYHNNPMLAHAARRACKASGKTVLLTATPPPEQKRAMRQRRLPHAMVPVRYHRHPLPEPRILRYRGLNHMLGAGRLPSTLRAALDESLQRGAQIFVFVPRIEHVAPLTRMLRKACADAVAAAAVDGTSSRDADRAERVRRFRSGEICILVTTTILERGVTIPRSDVYVLDADAALFDEATLVQMAGRAGRSADDPCGRVYYVARERTDGTQLAVRHIRAMNALARKRGLLRDEARMKEVRDAKPQSYS